MKGQKNCGRPILSYKNTQNEILLLDNKIKEQEKESGQLNIKFNETIEEEKSIPSLNEKIKNNQEAIYKYDNLKPKFNEITDLNIELEKLVEKGKQKRNEVNSFGKELKALSDQNLSLQEDRIKLEPIEKSKSGLEILVGNLKEIQVKHTHYLQNKKLEEALKLETEYNLNQYNSAAEKNNLVEKSYSNLEIKWRKSQSALLAITLKNDMPCPVCGSLSHPQPAEISDETVSDNELNTLKSRKRNYLCGISNFT